ncbi:hypothetical protein DFH09DRAFT_1375917 [Mycena vulgaris]|nr:hypothetical protein DFH09DRAFT_1375917 [Mycena vulgaris]
MLLRIGIPRTKLLDAATQPSLRPTLSFDFWCSRHVPDASQTVASDRRSTRRASIKRVCGAPIITRFLAFPPPLRRVFSLLHQRARELPANASGCANASDLYLYILPSRERLDAPAKAPIVKCWISRSREQRSVYFALRHAINAPRHLNSGFRVHASGVAFALPALTPAHVNFGFGLPANAGAAPSIRRAALAFAPPSGQQRAINALDVHSLQATVHFALPPAAIAQRSRGTTIGDHAKLNPIAIETNRAMTSRIKWRCRSTSSDSLPCQQTTILLPMVDLQHSWCFGVTRNPQLAARPLRTTCGAASAFPRSFDSALTAQALTPDQATASARCVQQPRRKGVQPHTGCSMHNFHAARVPRLEPGYATPRPRPACRTFGHACAFAVVAHVRRAGWRGESHRVRLARARTAPPRWQRALPLAGESQREGARDCGVDHACSKRESA